MQDLHYWSIYHKYELDILLYLHRQGHCNVNVNIVENAVGFCPLALAIVGKNFHIVDVLVENGADVNLPNHLGTTSLQIAVAAYGTGGQIMKEEPYMAEV